MPENTDLRPGSLTELIICAQSGDSKCQEELYRRFKPMIYKMARSMPRNDQEDARQELICELLLAANRFEPDIDSKM